jgi:rubrerythrin
MCGQQWDGQGRDFGPIPESLPRPESGEWVRRLQEILALEKHSKMQYEKDSSKYNAAMPYRMVIPQEDNHIRWIGRLFSAYGVPSDGNVPSMESSEDLGDAYEIAMQLEERLVPRYEWLVQNAEDKDSAQTLDTILLQTRMHYTMFNHALRMGGMMNRGMMGPGMMGR